MSMKRVFIINEGIYQGTIPAKQGSKQPKGPFTVVGYNNVNTSGRKDTFSRYMNPKDNPENFEMQKVNQKTFDNLEDADDQLVGFSYSYDDFKIFDADGNDITTSDDRERHIYF